MIAFDYEKDCECYPFALVDTHNPYSRTFLDPTGALYVTELLGHF